MKDEVVSYMLDSKNFSPAFLVIEEHAHYMNMCASDVPFLPELVHSNTSFCGTIGSILQNEIN